MNNKLKIDEETGEIVDYNLRFVQLYAGSLGMLSQLSKAEFKMIFALVEYVCTKRVIDLTFHAGKRLRKYCASIGISDKSIYNILSSLCKKGIIVRLERGTYMFNKKFIFKGKIV